MPRFRNKINTTLGGPDSWKLLGVGGAFDKAKSRNEDRIYWAAAVGFRWLRQRQNDPVNRYYT